MLQGILLAAIVILLLVVLVPVGAALFQRLRPERNAPPPPAPRPKPLPPQRPSDIPTAKIAPPPEVLAAARPPAPAPAPVAAPPPSAPPKKIDATAIDQVPQQNEPSGTEMLQWYGMLNCTSGPLQGQRFIVDDAGFYIGRDPVLATVVIPDTKVSKRHVRIVPRDGKVWAIDEGSTNGTFLAGKSERITEVQLERGDTLVIGDNVATFVYQI
jgi:Inner membrane component of T3SS, cytoplasmic domain